jgi:tRNA threonylcarbamoyladenosine biosynthesis protein TsaB
MVTLALDTTTRAGSVAVLRGEVLLSVVHGDAARTHGERLPGELDRALAAAGIRPTDLELLAVASGPGAFTGLRIGLAVIQGMAMVRGIPTVGVSALDALAEAARESTPAATAVATWMDAQRGEIFAAHVLKTEDAISTWAVSSAPVVADPVDVLRDLPSQILTGGVFIGDGAARYRAEVLQFTNHTGVVVDAPAALAPFIGRLGRARAQRGEAGPPHALQPLYVRRSDAELAKHRAIALGGNNA